MNPTIYKQLDSRWSSKPYPTYSSSFGGNGCGCCACVHVAMEQERYRNWNPESLRPWMVKQGFAYVNQGTTWNGITETLKYIGHKNVVRIWNDPMTEAWKELNKGNRIGVLLVDNGRTPDGTYWTSSGHYVAFTGYKVESGRHWFFCKDSGGRGHDGWYCYEKSIKGALPKLWIVERLGNEPQPVPPQPTGKLIVDGDAGYNTIKRLQEFFKLSDPDGLIGGQFANQQKYRPAVTSVSNGGGGSKTVTALQKWCGLDPDGIWGQNTSKGLQKKLVSLGYLAKTEKVDGIAGAKTIKALQTYLNDQLK